jgi:endoglucanase
MARRPRSVLRALVLSIAIVPPALSVAADASHWPEWEQFERWYVSADGRVVDRSVTEQITTSEGQSYALFFALVANDRAAFARLLRWTQNNLADGDLARRLPAWQWGRAADGAWRKLDDNSAADSDLWIAYTLGEAGRLWCEPSYTTLGSAVAARMLREEVAHIPKLGATLLPGPRGFVTGDTWRLNASYVPIQLLRGLARQTRAKLWNDLIGSSERLILASAPRGFAADWIQYRPKDGFIVDHDTHGIGSYNAIRVYLWAGTLATSDPLYPQLAKRLQPMVASTAARNAPVESVDTHTLAMQGDGSPGFSAALLPLLSNAKQTDAVAKHRARVATQALVDGESYYSDVLALFGLGWLEGRYRFERSGELTVRHAPSCPGAR